MAIAITILVQILSAEVDILPDGDLNGLAAGDHAWRSALLCCERVKQTCLRWVGCDQSSLCLEQYGSVFLRDPPK